jgi:hypothetical protein
MPDPIGAPVAHHLVVRAAPDEGPFHHPLNPASEVYGASSRGRWGSPGSP